VTPSSSPRSTPAGYLPCSPAGSVATSSPRTDANASRPNAPRHGRCATATNGTLGTVVGSDGHDLVVDTDDGERRTLPLHYIIDGQLTHAYAFTIHRAQGLTVDVALLLGDDTLFAEAGYTGITRGRDQNRLYLVDADEGDALKIAQRALERSAAKHTAIEQLGLGL